MKKITSSHLAGEPGLKPENQKFNQVIFLSFSLSLFLSLFKENRKLDGYGEVVLVA